LRNHKSNNGDIMRPAMRATPLFFAFLLCAAATAAPPDTLRLFDDAPYPDVKIVALAPDTTHMLEGDRVSADAALRPAFPDSAIELARSKRADNGAALTLRWEQIWKSGIGMQMAPQDLRPYLARGTLAFDLKVDALDKGGLMIKVGCGPDCERQVPYVLPGRAAQGKGWQRVVLAMSCFVRDGDDFSQVAKPFTLEGTGSGQVSIANVAIAPGGTPNTACADWRTVAVTPAKLDEAWSIEWWLPRHQQKLADTKRMVDEGRSPQLIFIGDSITQGWEKEGAAVWQTYYARHNAIGLGFGGDRTENVLWRLQHGAVDGIDPKVAVLMFGTNNTGLRGDFPAVTLAGIRRNLEELQRRLPRTRILLVAIFPRDATPDSPLRRTNDAINAQLPTLADGKKVVFLDVNQAFLGEGGTLSKDIMPDLLHPNAAGYAIWAKAMAPALDRLMALPRLE
jgi:lysophospholipase L1-like esterase